MNDLGTKKRSDGNTTEWEKRDAEGKLRSFSVSLDTYDQGRGMIKFFGPLLVLIWGAWMGFGSLGALFAIGWGHTEGDMGAGLFLAFLLGGVPFILYLMHGSAIPRLREPFNSKVTITLDFENMKLRVEGGSEAKRYKRGIAGDLFELQFFDVDRHHLAQREAQRLSEGGQGPAFFAYSTCIYAHMLHPVTGNERKCPLVMAYAYPEPERPYLAVAQRLLNENYEKLQKEFVEERIKELPADKNWQAVE